MSHECEAERPDKPFVTNPHRVTPLLMPNNYRIYRLDRASHIVEVEWVAAASDEEAIATARAMKRSSKCEIWQGERLVATVRGMEPQERSRAIWL